MIKKIKQLIFKHKIKSALILIIAAVLSFYGFKFLNKSEQEIKYVLASVQKGTIVASVTGSGQISALQQLDVKPKVSGTITYVAVKAGQKVSLGQVLAYLDSKDAQKSARDAEINLESAQISLEKMMRSQQTAIDTNTNNLSQSYKDAYNKTADAFLDLPNLIDLARGVLYDNTISSICSDNICAYNNLSSLNFRSELKQFINQAENDYILAKESFDSNFIAYRNIRLDAEPEEIIFISETTEKTAELIAQAVKSEQNILDVLVNDINNEASKRGNKALISQQIAAYQSSIGSALGKLNSIVSGLGNARRSIESAQRTIDDTQLSNPIDLKSQENTVAQRQASLEDARSNLENYTILAPFSGIVAKSDVKAGDQASGSAVIATLLTEQSIAEISLNEVDIAQIKAGQKATLAFDAVEDLAITGQVIDVDSLGTTSQGVVTYGVKISLDTQDERIKPGMSVLASIITSVKQNVLLIPNSAVKFANGINYVEAPDNSIASDQLIANVSNNAGIVLGAIPRQQTIEVGLANDSNTEVISGLQEGDIIIARSVTSASGAQANTQQGNSLFPTGGNRSAGGGAVRTFTR